MPVAQFSFGSFGDITAVLQLAWAILAALRDVAGAAGEIQQLIDDIDTFTRSLQQVKAVIDGRSIELNQDICNGITHALSICHEVLSAVEHRISSYKKSLMRKHGVSWRKYWSMVAWSVLGGKKAVDALKQRLSEQVQAVHTYLSLAQSNDQARLLDAVNQHGTTLTRVSEVVTDISTRFTGAIPAFHFQDPFDGKYYMPMGRTSLNSLAEMYERFTGERTSAADFEGEETHRMMLIPIGFRYHPSAGWQLYAMIDCYIYRDPTSGQTQVLMSAPWIVSRWLRFAGVHTPFYERIGLTRGCTLKPSLSSECTHLHLKPSLSSECTHLHFKSCNRILVRQDNTLSDFWENHRYKSLIDLRCYDAASDKKKPPSLLHRLRIPDDNSRELAQAICAGVFPAPGMIENREVCLAMSPIVKLRGAADCRNMATVLGGHRIALLGEELLRRIDKHASQFTAQRDIQLLWMCWAEELRKTVLTTTS